MANSMNYAVSFTGRLGYVVEKILYTMSNQEWRSAAFVLQVKGVYHKVAVFRRRIGAQRPVANHVQNLYLSAWERDLIIGALTEWRNQYYRVRPIGSTKWISLQELELRNLQPKEYEVGRRSKAVDIALRALRTAPAVRAANR